MAIRLYGFCETRTSFCFFFPLGASCCTRVLERRRRQSFVNVCFWKLCVPEEEKGITTGCSSLVFSFLDACCKSVDCLRNKVHLVIGCFWLACGLRFRRESKLFCLWARENFVVAVCFSFDSFVFMLEDMDLYMDFVLWNKTGRNRSKTKSSFLKRNVATKDFSPPCSASSTMAGGSVARPWANLCGTGVVPSGSSNGAAWPGGHEFPL